MCLVVRDEAAHLEATLASCDGFADEIVVVDTGSHDQTIEIARSHPRVALFHEPFENFSQAHGASLAKATAPWVLQLAADERVSPALAKRLQAFRREPAIPPTGGVRIRRRNRMMGRWMTSMGLDREYPLRLFRREGARLNGRLVHEGIELPEEWGVETWQEPLEHHTFANIEAYVRKIDLYTTLEVREGQRRFGRAHLAVVFPSTFLRFFVARQGWRDGWPGFVWATLTAIGFFLRDVKLWEAQHQASGPAARD